MLPPARQRSQAVELQILAQTALVDTRDAQTLEIHAAHTGVAPVGPVNTPPRRAAHFPRTGRHVPVSFQRQRPVSRPRKQAWVSSLPFCDRRPDTKMEPLNRQSTTFKIVFPAYLVGRPVATRPRRNRCFVRRATNDDAPSTLAPSAFQRRRLRSSIRRCWPVLLQTDQSHDVLGDAYVAPPCFGAVLPLPPRKK